MALFILKMNIIQIKRSLEITARNEWCNNGLRHQRINCTEFLIFIFFVSQDIYPWDQNDSELSGLMKSLGYCAPSDAEIVGYQPVTKLFNIPALVRKQQLYLILEMILLDYNPMTLFISLHFRSKTFLYLGEVWSTICLETNQVNKNPFISSLVVRSCMIHVSILFLNSL
jgi:hypothetical protein